MKGVGCSTQVGRSPLRDAPPRYQMSALGRFQSAIQLSTAHIPTFFSRDRVRGLVAIGPMLSSEECICISQPERQDVVHFAISMSREIKIQNMTRQFTHFCISLMHNSNVFSWDDHGSPVWDLTDARVLTRHFSAASWPASHPAVIGMGNRAGVWRPLHDFQFLDGLELDQTCPLQPIHTKPRRLEQPKSEAFCPRDSMHGHSNNPQSFHLERKGDVGMSI